MAGTAVGGRLSTWQVATEDGYRAERSYSIATSDGEPVAITVERLDERARIRSCPGFAVRPS
jgi:ferredoxin-NADP reductase